MSWTSSTPTPGDEQLILADRLQAQGDVRGELLALELAVVRAPDVGAARSLSRAAQQLRSREAQRVWPEELVELGGRMGMSLRLRAGLVLELAFTFSASEQAKWVRSSPHARWLESFCGRGLAELPAVPSKLIGDDSLYEFAEADALAELRSLRSLEIYSRGEHQAEGERALAEAIAALPTLESLSLPVHRRATLPTLRAAAGLSHLRLTQCAREDLALLATFDALRSLELGALGPVTPDAEAALVESLALLGQLDGLRVDSGGSAPNWRSLLPRLSVRRLDLLAAESLGDVYGWRRAHAPLVELTQLEHLGVHHRFVPQGLFERLPELRSLELWGEQGPGRRSVPRAELARLEQLRVGVPLLPWLRAPALTRLVLGGGRELRGAWSELEQAGIGPALRELEVYELPAMSEPASKRVLAQLERLTLIQAPSEADLEFVRGLPSLRRLCVPGLDPARHRALCEALPELLVETTRFWPRPR